MNSTTELTRLHMAAIKLWVAEQNAAWRSLLTIDTVRLEAAERGTERANTAWERAIDLYRRGYYVEAIDTLASARKLAATRGDDSNERAAIAFIGASN